MTPRFDVHLTGFYALLAWVLTVLGVLNGLVWLLHDLAHILERIH